MNYNANANFSVPNKPSYWNTKLYIIFCSSTHMKIFLCHTSIPELLWEKQFSFFNNSMKGKTPPLKSLYYTQLFAIAYLPQKALTMLSEINKKLYSGFLHSKVSNSEDSWYKHNGMVISLYFAVIKKICFEWGIQKYEICHTMQDSI